MVPVPFGVALVIGPWNYPNMLSLVPTATALAAGNTVILKPSEVTSNASAALASLINKKFLKELFHVVEGGVEETTVLLKEKFDKIFFTGSSRVGRIVMKPAPVALYIFSKDVGQARRILREVPSGGGMVNDVVLQFINMNTPFG